MKSKTKIRGSGGIGDTPESHVPVDDPDTLRSKAYYRALDLTCEGEIEGLVDGAKSIFLEETPLQNSDGSYNFSGITYETRNGTQDQTALPGNNTVESETSVNVEIKKNADDPGSGDVIRQVTNPNLTRIRVRILIPQLTTTDPATGDISGGSVRVQMYIQPSGGSYALAVDRTIKGKTSSRYEVELSSELTGDAPWNVKLVRVTDDSTNDLVVNKCYWEAYTEVIDAKLRYPNSSLIGIRIDSQAFQNVPSRYYDLKLLKIRVPINYDPETRVYTGSWNGAFQTLWSDNPAWVFYDLCTSDRYGLGAFIPEDQVDKWALYEIARYCDELVSDGFGGTEPRFTCNLMIFDRGEAYTILQSLASVFRGMIYWAAGAVTATQDSPQDAVSLYNQTNVIDGKFQYQGASAKAQHSVAVVTWNDPEDFYRPKIEYVEDQTAITKLGIQQTEVTAFGCTSRGQAHRLGKWLLYTEQNESETVTFQTGLDGIIARPGQIIKIADPVRAGVRTGGRISSASASVVTIDSDPFTAVSGYTLSVLLADGTIEDRTIVSQNGRALGVQPAFSSAPNAKSVWIIQNSEIEAQTFRVIGITEEAGPTFTITALKHDPDKFDFVESDISLEEKSYSLLKQAPDAPSGLAITESLYQSGSTVKSKATFSWNRVDRATSYVVRYRKDDENFVELKETQVNEVEVLDTQPGTYTFVVTAINAISKRSVPTSIDKELFGKAAPPVDVSGFSMIPNAGQAYLSWTQATDLDVLVGGQVRIRHTPNIVDQAWKDAVDVIPAVSGSATSAIAPLLSGTYMAKFLDSSGNYSTNEVLIVTSIPYASALNVVQTITESPTFPGVKTDMLVDTTNAALSLSSGELVDDFPLIDDVGNWDFPGDIASSGTYDFENTFDLGAVYPSRIYSTIDLEAVDIANFIDARTDLIDDWQDIDGDMIDDVNAELYIRTTEDNPSSSPTWTDWKRIRAGEYLARGMQFQLRCTSGSENHTLLIKTLQVVIDMADRAINLGSLTSGLGASYRVDYSEPFRAQPVVSITADSLNSGDFYNLSSQSATGFNIVFKNSSGTIVSRVFSVIAKGYGRQVA
jgi:predicted phage tail protein